MTVLASTIPGAVSTLQTHMQNVATANPALNPSVYVGPVVAPKGPAANYLQIGEWETGVIWHSYVGDFFAIPGTSKLKKEDYRLYGTIRTWDADPTKAINRLQDAFTLFSGLLEELTNDIDGSGQLTPSGSWQITDSDNPYSGPFADAGGFGVVISFDVHVWNVQITSS